MKRIINFRIVPLILLSIIAAICTITFCSDALVIVTVLLAVTILLCAVFIKQFKRARAKLIICVLIFFIFLGLTNLSYFNIKNRQIYSENSIIEGDIDMLSGCDENGEIILDASSDFVSLYLENVTVDKREVKGKASAVFRRSAISGAYKIGDRIKFRGDIAPLNFAVTDANSMRSYRNGVYNHISCLSAPLDDDFLLVKIGEGMGAGDSIKLSLKKTLYSNTRSDTAGFLYAMTFGDKSGLDSEIKSSFSHTGTAHVFAVSGLHVGILAGALLWLFKVTKLRNRIARLSILAVFLSIICALCDFSPSTVRASIMVLNVSIAKAIGLRNDSLSSMSLAASIILLFKPLYLFDIGFLMSFLAVFGIIMLSKPLSKLFKKLPKKIGELLATSISVNLALLPLMIYYFEGETLLFVISNLLLLPVLGVCFPLYVIFAAISSVLPFMGWSVTVIAAPFTLIVMLIDAISKIPTFIVTFQSETAIIFFGVLATAALSKYVFVDKRAKKILAAVTCIALVFTMSASVRIWGRGNAYIHCFVDKYECQYVLIDNAYGGNYLIINDNVSSDTVDCVLKEMSGHKFSNLDGIVIVGDVSMRELEKLRLYTACPYVYTYSGGEVFDGETVAGNSIIEKGLVIAFNSSGCLDVTLGKRTLRVLAQDYVLQDNGYDILVAYSPIADGVDGKYIVCDTGFENSLENYVSGSFTFEINNDRIKVNRFWRY